MIICRTCLGVVKPISYGLPTAEALEDPEFYSGGCSIEVGQDAKYFCPNCEREMGLSEVIFG